MLQLRDIMTTSVVTVGPETTLRAVGSDRLVTQTSPGVYASLVLMVEKLLLPPTA